MSSEPFKLGLSIVERLVPQESRVVLRTRNRDEMIRIIMRTRKQLTVRDLILVREMGLRPDRPISTPAWFAEVAILTDVSQETRMDYLRQIDWRVYEGKRRGRIIV